MSITFAYPVRFQRAEEGGWVITCRDLPEVVSQADDDEDRVEVAEGALQAAVEVRILEGEELPSPSAKRADEEYVTLPIETATKAALHLVVREMNVTKSDLARRIDIDEKEARRLMNPHHASKLPRIAQAVAAYGRRLQIRVVKVDEPHAGGRKEVRNMSKRNETTSKQVASMASKLLPNPKTPSNVKSVAASALTQKTSSGRKGK